MGPILGLALGRFGEASNSVHSLIDLTAKSRVKQINQARGKLEEQEKGDLAYKIGYIHRRLSSAIVVCFGQWLAGHMSQVGPGAALASQRRQIGLGKKMLLGVTEKNCGWKKIPAGKLFEGVDFGQNNYLLLRSNHNK